MAAAGAVEAAELDILMEMSKAMTAVVARSFADIDTKVNVPQLRVLVMLRTRRTMNMSAVAVRLGVNPSNASRTCERLVDSGLVQRRHDAEDRRSRVLSLTPRGEALVDDLMGRRREILAEVVTRMRPQDRRRLTAGLRAFLDAASRPPGQVHDVKDPASDLMDWIL